MRERSTLKLSFGVSFAAAAALMVVLLFTAQPAEATAYTATSGAGNWSDPTKWFPNGVPGSAAGDTVSIISPITMDYAMPNDLAGFTLNGTLTFAAGGNLRLGAGTHSNNGTMNVTAGTLTIVGTTLNIPGAGTFTVSNATITASSGILSCNGCNMTIGGTTVTINGLTLNNTGTVVFSTSGTLNLGGGTQINVNSPGVFDIRNNANVHWTSNPQVAINVASGGILRKTTTAGTTTFTNGAQLHNNGLVEGQAGTIQVPVGTSSGTFSATLPNTIDFANAAHDVAGASIAGNGVRLNGGTITGTGALSILNTATLTWSSGTMGGTGTTTVNSGGTLNISGTVQQNQRIIDNFGLVIFSAAGGTYNMGGAAVFNNKPVGIFDAQNSADSAINWNLNPQVNFNNEGLFRKTTTAGGVTRFTNGVLFNNTGTVDGLVGTIEIVGGTSTGTFQATSPATVDFKTGVHTMNGAQILGNGVRLNGGTLSGPVLNISSPGVMTWSAGTMSGATTDVTNVAAGATLKIAGSVQLAGRGISNSGSVIFSSGGATFNVGGGATFTNNPSGVFDDQNAVDAAITWNLNPPVAFNNAGTITKTAGPASTLIFTNGMVLNNTGNVTPQTGTIQIATGTSTGLFQANAPAAAVVFASGTHTMNGATVGGNGGVRLDGGTIGGPNFVIPVGATFTWASGTMGGVTTDVTNVAGGTMKITGAVQQSARTIQNTGTVIFASNGGTFNMGGGASFNNQNGGIFDDQNTVDTQIFWNVNPQVFFNNAGILKKTAGAAAKLRFPNGVLLNNTGTVDAQAGTIEIGSGTSTGVFTGTSPAIVGFTSGTHTMNGASVNGNAVRLAGGTINGTNFIINNAATFSWISGTMSGVLTDATTINTGGTMVIDGPVSLSVRKIENNGLIKFISSAATFNVGGGASINNNAAGVFDAQNAANTLLFWNTNPPVAFNNAGLFRKTTTAAGKTIFSGVVLNNTGTVDAQVGTIDVESGTSTGAFTTAAGTTINFTSGTHTLNSGATLNGPGIRLDGATLTGTGVNIASGGTLTWVLGTMSGAGQTTTISSGGTLVYSGSGTLTQRTLSNNGTFIFASGTSFSMGGGAIFNNNAGGVFDDQNTVNDQLFWATNPPVTFNNAGIFKKTATAGTTTTLSGVPFNNSGTVDAQVGTIRIGGGSSGGTFTTAAAGIISFFTGTHTLTTGANFTGSGKFLLAGGTLASSQPVTINGGTLGGSGTINANVMNNSIVAPGVSPGGITINGSYTQAAGASLNIELAGTAPASGYDRLTVNGAANLAGTLNVTLIGGYVPAGGEQYTPLLFTSRSGDFATKNLPTFGGGSFTTTYTATALRLDAVVTNPDLAVTQSSPATAGVGQNVVFTITVTNGAVANATNVVLTETFSGATFVSAVPSTGTCSGTGPITCNFGTLLVNGTATLTLTVNANAPGTITSNASVTATEPDPNTANNSSVATVTVNPTADLGIAKSTAGPVVAGQSVTYTIVVTNNGPSSAAAVTVADPTPAGLTFLANTGACTTPFPCALGTVASGATPTIFAKYAVSPAATGSITNVATVSSTTTDPNNANQTSTVTSPITQSADLSISKNGPDSARPGTNIVYTIRVTNRGPSEATNVIVSDPTPSRLTFISNSGACTTPFPCNLGTIANGQIRTITATYEVAAGTTSAINNTASVSSSTPDPFTANNSDTERTVTACPPAPAALVPAAGASVPASGVLSWDFTTSAEFNVYLGRAGSGCTAATPFATSTGRSAPFSGLEEGAEYEWRVEAVVNGCPRVTSQCQRFTVARSCNAAVPQLLTPANGQIAASPVTFSWTSTGVPGTIYRVIEATSGTGLVFPIGTTTATSLTANIGDGPLTWYVSADVPGCPPLQSARGTFNTCNVPPKPIASVIGQASSNQRYTLSWTGERDAVFEIQQADNAAFIGAETIATDQTSATFRVAATSTALSRHYRVRQKTPCATAFGPYSLPVRVVIVPLPPRGQGNPNVNVSAGSKELVIQEVFIPGEPGNAAVVTFTATVDKPWLSVRPSSGVLPPDGVTLEVTGDPSNLPNGTFTGTVLVTINTPTSSRSTSNGTVVKNVPVSVTLVTPVTPTGLQQPPDGALVIPSTGHLDGINSQWQSDVRVTNTSFNRMRYQLTFTAAGADVQSGVKQTIIEVDPGATTALDDIVRNWYGIGSLGDSANGVLAIHAVDSNGNPEPPSNGRVTVVSSRTYNATANGTLGQYIPAIPFADFIGRTSPDAAAQILSLQQIAHSSAFRTNVGIVEASGKPASVKVSVFDAAGTKLADVPFELAASEQKQLNSFLSTLGINNLADGRIEVQVTGGDGRVTAYASVVDNGTSDPLLVSGSLLRGISANRYVLPGVADINTGVASWRTDMRVFNGGTGDQAATLTFYPQDNGTPRTANVLVKAGEVKSLDSVLQSVFNAPNNGGAVHVTTPGSANLVVTGRTYNMTEAGTYGQFVPAVTLAEAVGADDRSLEIQQIEDSPRFRTNVGFTEVSGKDVQLEVSVTLPDSRISPKFVMDLPANSFRQSPVLRDLGLGNVYNARISVKVIGGEGKVSAYGSVIDMITQDPTYVPAQ